MTSCCQPTGAARNYDLPGLNDSNRSIEDEKLARHYIAMMCPAPGAQDDRRYAAGILSDVLGDADGSRLYWALVDPGLADEADFSYISQDGIGYYFAFASCDAQRAEQVEQILLETIDQYAGGIDPEEIERAKNKTATEATLQGESPGGRMRGLGGQWTYLGKYIPLADEIARVMRVSAEDVRELVTDLPFTPRTIVRLGPQAR